MALKAAAAAAAAGNIGTSYLLVLSWDLI